LLTAVKSGKVLLYVAILLKSDKPETFNDETQVTLLDKVVVPDIFKTPLLVVLPLFLITKF
jgi:hypothetical protein